MKYPKPPLSFEQQAELLVDRGLQGDPLAISQRLRSVSYYRLSGYSFPFRNADDSFMPGTSFDAVWDRYAFDRRFRLLVMDAVERIEVAIRSQLSYHHAQAFGPFGYATDPGSLPALDTPRRDRLLERVREDVDHSKETFVAHFKTKYGDSHADLPIWMATEVMAFGSILTLYKGSPKRIRKAVASSFGLPSEVLGSWLLTLNAVRNICAHHGRLWNRVLGVKPMIPRQPGYPDWHSPFTVENDRLFVVLTICNYCLRLIAPQSRWPVRLRELLKEFAAVPQREMGFPDNWRACPIWLAGQNG